MRDRLQLRDTSPPGWHAQDPGIARTRLFERLAQARRHRSVVLQAPAGCGKTSLLLAWRRDLMMAGVDIAWLALGNQDDEPARFFDALFAGLAKINPDLVREATVLAGRGSGKDAVECVVIALVRAIDAHRRDLALVFDNVHLLRDATIVAALQLLLDYAPPNLLCAFATRSTLPLSLGRLRAQQLLLELGADDLRFTQSESAQLLAQLLGAVDERQARVLHERTDGWAAGLKLLGLDLRHPHSGALGPVRDAQTFARYFEQEVLSRLAPAELDFLVRCSLPEHFDAALCVELAGDSAPGLLERLEHQGLFIGPAGPRYPKGWRRLHPLLRDSLLERLSALPTPNLRGLHATAWRYFAMRAMFYDAVHHALLAGETTAAAELVEECATGLFVRGELRHLVGLVRQLPEALIEQRVGLRLWLAWVQVYEQRLEQCARSVEQLQGVLAQAPAVVRYRLTLLRGLLAVQCDDTAAAMAILPDLLVAPADADGIALTGRRNLLTWVYLYRGEYEKARRVQLDDPPPLVHGQPLYGTAFGLLAGRCLIGLTHAVQGQVIQAERIYRDVLFEVEKRGVSCADAGTLAAGLLGEVLYELNDSVGALGLLEERLDVLERVSIPDTALRVMLVLGRSRWLAGRPLDALDFLEQMEDRGERMGLDRLRAYSQLEQIQFRLQQGDVAQARTVLARLEELDARHAGVESGTLSEIRVAAERGRIRVWMHTGELDLALARLAALAELCRQRGRARRIPYLLLQSAAVERRLRRHDAARTLVREALRMGHQLGLVRTLLDAHEDAVPLIRDAARETGLDPVLVFYAERLDAAARDHAAGVAARPARAKPGIEVLSPREGEIVQLLLRSLPNKKIARVLDLSLDTVKWHLKNIYGKLGVSGRDEVVERFTPPPIRGGGGLASSG